MTSDVQTISRLTKHADALTHYIQSCNEWIGRGNRCVKCKSTRTMDVHPHNGDLRSVRTVVHDTAVSVVISIVRYSIRLPRSGRPVQHDLMRFVATEPFGNRLLHHSYTCTVTTILITVTCQYQDPGQYRYHSSTFQRAPLL